MSEQNGSPKDHLPAGGNGGVVYGREQQVAGGIRNLRSDARLVARLLSMGCIPVERAEQLLRAGAKLAARCAKAGDPRGYAACMGTLLKAVSLEQSEFGLKQSAPQINVAVGVRIAQQDNFYGHGTDAHSSEASAASSNGHAIAGPIQDAGLRAKVEQNGNGLNGSNGRPRPEAGGPQGGH